MLKKRYIVVTVLVGALAFYGQAALSGSVVCDGGFAPTKPMPVSGKNFASYCQPCIAALRTYAREPVIDTLTAAFADMHKSNGSTKFLYGEMGFPDGGRFRPHRTHRKGLSVDLMVPLKDGRVLQSNMLNKFGYDIEFDSTGVSSDGVIDFLALAKLLASLRRHAKSRGGAIRRVFFASDLQPYLKNVDVGLFTSLSFNKKQAWVRHDEHIHVDFSFPCNRN